MSKWVCLNEFLKFKGKDIVCTDGKPLGVLIRTAQNQRIYVNMFIQYIYYPDEELVVTGTTIA